MSFEDQHFTFNKNNINSSESKNNMCNILSNEIKEGPLPTFAEQTMTSLETDDKIFEYTAENFKSKFQKEQYYLVRISFVFYLFNIYLYFK